MHTLEKRGLGPGAGKCVSDNRGGRAARTRVAVQEVLPKVVLPRAVLPRVVLSWSGAHLDGAPQGGAHLGSVHRESALLGGSSPGSAHLADALLGRSSPGWLLSWAGPHLDRSLPGHMLTRGRLPAEVILGSFFFHSSVYVST